MLNTTAAPVDEHQAISIEGLKLMSIFCTLGLSLSLNFLVILCPHLNSNPYMISIANSFSSGIFIALSVTHLLGESTAEMTHYYSAYDLEKFRPSFAMACVGYFTMVMIQRALFSFDHGATVATQTPVDEREDQHNDDENNEEEVDHRASGCHNDAEPAEDQRNLISDPASSPTTTIEMMSPAAQMPAAAEPATAITTKRESFENSSNCSSHAGAEHKRKKEASGNTPLSVEPFSTDAEEKEDEEGKEPSSCPGKEHLSLFILLAVFSLHSFTEGFVVGLQDTKRGVIVVFLAIFLHQWAEDVTFSLATGKSSTLPRGWRIAMSTIEAVSCPAGIAVGWGVRLAISQLASAYFIAFSAGTFIMMSCTETVAHEMPAGQARRAQFIAMVVGATMLYIVLFLLVDL